MKSSAFSDAVSTGGGSSITPFLVPLLVFELLLPPPDVAADLLGDVTFVAAGLIVTTPSLLVGRVVLPLDGSLFLLSPLDLAPLPSFLLVTAVLVEGWSDFLLFSFCVASNHCCCSSVNCTDLRAVA